MKQIKKKRNQSELEEQNNNFVENITETNSDIDTRSLSYISDISSYHSEIESDTEFKADTYSVATATDNSVNQEDETEQYYENKTNNQNQYPRQQVIEIKEENYEMKNYREKAESENELTQDYQTESYEIRKKKKYKKKSNNKSKKKSKIHNPSDEEEVNV